MNYEQGLTKDTFASLRFSGEHLEPHLVTQILKVDPTRSCYRGEHSAGSGRASETISHEGWWLLRTKKLTRSKTLKDHTDKLLMLMTGDRNTLLSVSDMVQNRDVRLWVSLFWFGGLNAAQPEVDPLFAKFIAQLGGEIDTDFHTQSDEGSKPEAA